MSYLKTKRRRESIGLSRDANGVPDIDTVFESLVTSIMKYMIGNRRENPKAEIHATGTQIEKLQRYATRNYDTTLCNKRFKANVIDASDLRKGIVLARGKNWTDNDNNFLAYTDTIVRLAKERIVN